MKRATILFQLDPDLVPAEEWGRYAQFERPLRIVPCKGGAALRRGSRAQVFETPEDMAAHLYALSFVHSAKADDYGGEETASGRYYADGAAFLRCAAYHVEKHPGIRGVWLGEK